MSGDGLFGPPKPADVCLADKIKELERELKMRHAVYPKLIARGRMTREESTRRIVILRAIMADYAAAGEKA